MMKKKKMIIETIKANKNQTEAPQDHRPEMADLYLTFPNKMEELLERLEGGEISEMEVSIELDKLTIDKRGRERS